MCSNSLLVIPDELFHFMNADCSSQGARFLRLPHPRTGLNSLFLQAYSAVDGNQSVDQLLELQAIDPDAQRSWLFNNSVISNGRLLVATAIDPAYLLAPLLAKHAKTQQERQIFLDSDSLLDALANNSDLIGTEHEVDFRRLISMTCVVKSLSRMCEIKYLSAAGIETYAYSEERWLHYLQRKVSRLNELISHEQCAIVARELAKDGIVVEDSVDLLALGRLKSACNILSQYLPSELYLSLLERYDFSSLNQHVQQLRSEESALMAAKTKKKSKSGPVETVKRKAATQISRGVDKLKRVDTGGMSKLSSFFSKSAKVSESHLT